MKSEGIKYNGGVDLTECADAGNGKRRHLGLHSDFWHYVFK